jgi:hypothetical protein
MRFTCTELSKPLPKRSKQFALAAEVIYVHVEYKQFKTLMHNLYKYEFEV